MSKNTHRTRIARALSQHTEQSYQTCLTAVRAAAEAGALPAPIDEQPIDALVAIAVTYLPGNTSGIDRAPVPTPDGLILVAGPTGTGKSTSLADTLVRMRHADQVGRAVHAAATSPRPHRAAPNLLLAAPHARVLIVGNSQSGKTRTVRAILEDWHTTYPDGHIIILTDTDTEYPTIPTAVVLDSVSIAPTTTVPDGLLDAIAAADGQPTVVVIDESTEATAPTIEAIAHQALNIHLVVTAHGLTTNGPHVPHLDWTAVGFTSMRTSPSAATHIFQPRTTRLLAPPNPLTVNSPWEAHEILIETPQQTIVYHLGENLANAQPLREATRAHWEPITRTEITQGLRRISALLRTGVPLTDAAQAIAADCTAPSAHDLFASVHTDPDRPGQDPLERAAVMMTDIFGNWAALFLRVAGQGGNITEDLDRLVDTIEADRAT